MMILSLLGGHAQGRTSGGLGGGPDCPCRRWSPGRLRGRNTGLWFGYVTTDRSQESETKMIIRTALDGREEKRIYFHRGKFNNQSISPSVRSAYRLVT